MKKKVITWTTLSVVVLALTAYIIRHNTPNTLPTSITIQPKAKLSMGVTDGLMSHPLDVAVSKIGQVYVSDSGNNQVKVFNTEGRFLFAFGQAGKGMGQFNSPYGIAVMPDGSLLVSDMLNFRIQRFSQDGTFLGFFLPDTQKIKPGILRVQNNEVYVSDLASHQVMVYSEQGDFLQNYAGSMNFPQGIARVGEELFVADAGNNVIRKFLYNGEGTVKTSLGGQNNFQLLRGLAVDNLNRILVVDSLASRVVVMAEKGDVLFSFASAGNRLDQLRYPAGIAIDRAGNIYIADWGNNRVQVWGY